MCIRWNDEFSAGIYSTDVLEILDEGYLFKWMHTVHFVWVYRAALGLLSNTSSQKICVPPVANRIAKFAEWNEELARRMTHSGLSFKGIIYTH